MAGLDRYERQNAAADMFASIPEVVPPHMCNDGWAGAAAAEIRGEPYMPYPHGWDRTIGFVRVAHAMKRDEFDGMGSLPIEELDPDCVLRALPFVRQFELWRRRQVNAEAQRLLAWLEISQ